MHEVCGLKANVVKGPNVNYVPAEALSSVARPTRRPWNTVPI